VDVALAACDAADAVALRHFRRDPEASQKPDRTYVTVADQEIERLLRDRILSPYPDHGLVGEEYGTQSGRGSVRWYIDPIDGTHNYLRGVPVFATLLAVEREGELQAAGIRVSAVSTVAEAQVLYGDAPWIEQSGAAPGFRGLLASAWRTRGFGDFWGYALVAEGAAEAMLEVGLSPWDVAAPFVLVEEAGGRLTDLAGGRSVTARDYLASNGRFHDELLARLAGPAAGA
jgi:histidinol-phosphatase